MEKEYSKEEKRDFSQRYFETHRRKIHQKIMKKVVWNGKEFESITKLRDHLGYMSSSSVQTGLKNKTKVKGHVPRFGTL